MKFLMFSTTVILCLMVNSVLCQEEEGSDGFMSRFKNMVKKLWNDMKDIFNEFKQEVKARTTDMRDWSKEMFESFKKKMKEWIDQSSDASESERDDMREYLERIELERE
ncbi:unnamed protein product [Larinioides sclopetarius]|uniref:Uncharacterized protein n=1 Tax=Larinioides sclopetarius TaxID=280406 RepID=A0AAV1ZY15_9ARAC